MNKIKHYLFNIKYDKYVLDNIEYIGKELNGGEFRYGGGVVDGVYKIIIPSSPEEMSYFKLKTDLSKLGIISIDETIM